MVPEDEGEGEGERGVLVDRGVEDGTEGEEPRGDAEFRRFFFKSVNGFKNLGTLGEISFGVRGVLVPLVDGELEKSRWGTSVVAIFRRRRSTIYFSVFVFNRSRYIISPAIHIHNPHPINTKIRNQVIIRPDVNSRIKIRSKDKRVP